MPITKSAKKALRQDRRRQIRNLKIKDQLKKALRLTKKKPTAKNLSLAYQLLDRAAKKKVIHQNKANRLKSRLAHQS